MIVSAGDFPISWTCEGEVDMLWIWRRWYWKGLAFICIRAARGGVAVKGFKMVEILRGMV